MDQLTALLAAGGVITVGIALIVAIVVIAMPFLVWGIHSKVNEIRWAVADLESEVALMNTTLDSIEVMLDDVHGENLTPEAAAARAEFLRLRAEMLRSKAAGLEAKNSLWGVLSGRRYER